MDPKLAGLIAQKVLEASGVPVDVDLVRNDGNSIVTCFMHGLTSQEGPRVSIQRWGLKRYMVVARFGVYSVSIARTMREAGLEQYSLARGIIRQLSEDIDFDTKILPNQQIESWVITERDFEVTVKTKIALSGSETDQLLDLARRVMAPLFAAFAELMGYEIEMPDNELSQLGGHQKEGGVYQAMVMKRERSPLNRLLCLKIHGNKCAICGFDSESRYDGLPSLIEVHHIEALNELNGSPRVYDPSTDLMPLCPNCHSAIHKRRPAYTPEELRARLKNI